MAKIQPGYWLCEAAPLTKMDDVSPQNVQKWSQNTDPDTSAANRKQDPILTFYTFYSIK